MIIETIPVKCPKCQAKMTFYEAGYGKAKADDGDAAPICGHVSCWRCGYYKDIEEQVMPMEKEMIMKVQQPLPNKTIVGPTVHGEIKAFVHKEWKLISSMRKDKYNWDAIYAAVNSKAPSNITLTRQALINAYHRINGSKKSNAQFKSARANKNQYTRKEASP